jgi:hypothetical protein
MINASPAMQTGNLYSQEHIRDILARHPWLFRIPASVAI